MTNAIDNTKQHYFGWSLLFLSCLLAAALSGYYYVALVPFAAVLFCFGWQSLSIPFLLLIASLPFSTEIQLSSTLGTDVPDELLMVITSILFVLHVLWHPKQLSRQIVAHPLMILLILSMVWSIVTALSSVNGIISLKFILAKSWYLGAFVGTALILFQQKSMLRLTTVIFSIALAIVTAIVFIRHAQTGFTFATINDALRPYFRNHVNYSAQLVCLFPLLYAYWFYAKRPAARIFLILLISALLAALVLTYARGAWLALCIGAVSWWLIRKRALLKIYLLGVLAMIIAFCWLKADDKYLDYAHDYNTTIFHENFGEHLVATYKLKDLSTAERFYRWIAGVRMIEEKPLTGFGPNTFYENYKPYAVPAFKTWVSNNSEHSTVHNYFLLIAIEQGFPGLIIFLILCGLMFYFVEKVYHKQGEQFWRNVAIISGSIFAMLLTVNFLSDLIETDKIGSIFYLCLSAVIIADTRG